MKQEATKLGIQGWVRNRKDESVEAFVQGNEIAMRTIIDWAKRGPPSAIVIKFEMKEADAENILDFTRKETL